MLEPMTAADEAAITAQLQRPPRGVVGDRLPLSVRQARGRRNPASAARRHTLPDDVLPHVPTSSCSLLLAGVAGPDG